MSTDIEEAEVVEARSTALAVQDELTIEQLTGQVNKIQQAMEAVMRKDEHYGVIPGTNKPTLLKPGAEKLCLLFRLDPEYEFHQVFDDEHLTVTVTCTLYHIPTGNRVASGPGLCSTKESKYAYRNAKRVCPQCGKPAIIKGKKEYGGGWVCFKRQDGCGAKFGDNAPEIINQEVGRIDNEDLADSYNTVLKMACKRALVAAVLNGTGASDIFTQDVVETPEEIAEPQEEWWELFAREFGDAEFLDAVNQVSLAHGQGTAQSLRGVPVPPSPILSEILVLARQTRDKSKESGGTPSAKPPSDAPPGSTPYAKHDYEEAQETPDPTDDPEAWAERVKAKAAPEQAQLDAEGAR